MYLCTLQSIRVRPCARGITRYLLRNVWHSLFGQLKIWVVSEEVKKANKIHLEMFQTLLCGAHCQNYLLQKLHYASIRTFPHDLASHDDARTGLS